MKSTPRSLALRLLPLALAASIGVIAACGGGDDDGAHTGQLSDPNNVPTATPWKEAPDVVVLDPENLQVLPPSSPGGTTPTPAPGEPGVCGETYKVVAGDTTFGIADKCGVTVDGIQAANPGIDIRALTIGDVLKLPPANSSQ